MEFVLQSFITMVVMLLVDLPVIKYLILPAMQRTVGGLMAKKPDAMAGVIFYLGYASIVTYLAQQGVNDASAIAIQAFLIGIAAYGTYEFTSKAVMKGWTYKLAIADTIWGGVLTSIGVSVAYWAI